MLQLCRLGVAVLAALALAPRPDASPRKSVRYFCLSGKVDVEALRTALADAKADTAQGASRLLYGPASSKARPKQSFVAVETPADANPREIAHRLKKGCDGVDELAWTRFTGVDKALPEVLGQAPLDCVIGMASEMRWFEADGESKCFFHVPGKLGAKDIAERFHRLYDPFEAGELGTIEKETVSITLRDAPDAKALERVLKSLKKLDGVKSAKAEGTTITIEAELANLASSGAPSESTEPGARVPPLHFDASQALAIVAKEGLAPASK